MGWSEGGVRVRGGGMGGGEMAWPLSDKVIFTCGDKADLVPREVSSTPNCCLGPLLDGGAKPDRSPDG